MNLPTNIKGFQTLPNRIRDLDSICGEELKLHTFQTVVGWSDCDPAQIAYTARIPEWALKAIDSWYQYCLTADWYELNLKRAIGTPFASLSCDFLAPVTPNHLLKLHVYVDKLGNSSLSHRVQAYQADQACFVVNTTAVFVNGHNFQSIPIPRNIRANIENYQRNQNNASGS